MLQYNFNWKMLSAVAGLTFHDLYFRFYEGAIASQQVVEFLQALERHIDRPLLLIWDRLPAQLHLPGGSPGGPLAWCPVTS